MASRLWLQEFHRTGGNRNSTLRGWTQGFMHTRTQGQTYLLVLEGLLWRRGRQLLWLTAGTCTLAVVVLGSTHWHKLSWSPPFSHQQLASSNRCQCWDATDQTTNRTGTWPYPSSDRLLKVFLSTQLPNKHNPWHGPAHQRDKTQLHPPGAVPPIRKPTRSS